MGCARVEALSHGAEDAVNFTERDPAVVFSQNLDEAGHVRSLEVVGQVHVHADGGYRVLRFVLAVKHYNRMAQVAYAGFLKRDLTVVMSVLYVFHVRLCFGCSLGTLSGCEQAGQAVNPAPVLFSGRIHVQLEVTENQRAAHFVVDRG